MPLRELEAWMDEHNKPPDVLWLLKRLSANDTLATGAHQAGPYIPRSILFDVVPSLDRPNQKVSDVRFELRIGSHHDVREARAVWYKSKNEARITNLGGSSSALLDPESTGALTIFAFSREMPTQEFSCDVWVARNTVEEDMIEERTGPVDPGQRVTYPNLLSESRKSKCYLDEIPSAWLEKFPTGEEMVMKAIEVRSVLTSADVDYRLMTRRSCELEMYRSLENAVYMPRIREGFENVDDFLSVAQPIVQRRRSRGGRSLELHLKAIFTEETLLEGSDFAYQPRVGNQPDFLFPSADAYNDPDFPPERLRMLAVKSTVRERWKQILEEAPNVSHKHLLTLQEGVSEKQFTTMWEAGVRLVVPSILHKRYPRTVRPHLQTLESFIGEVREQAR